MRFILCLVGLFTCLLWGIDGGRTRDLSICSKSNDAVPIQCRRESYPHVWNTSRAVIRVWIKFEDFLFSHCTAWLLGCEGHVMTNKHCAKDQSMVDQLEFEFMAEGKTCQESCSDGMKPCPDTIRITEPLTLLKSGNELDYSLLKLPEKYSQLWKEFGYMKFRRCGAVKGERIYVPQHPLGKDKLVSMENRVNESDIPTTILETNVTNFNKCGPIQVTHDADTASGASGSPILGLSDNLVVALHHCGGCYEHKKNGAIPSDAIIEDLGEYLPNCAV